MTDFYTRWLVLYDNPLKVTPDHRVLQTEYTAHQFANAEVLRDKNPRVREIQIPKT
jgi:hypothetical protein